MGAMVEQSEIWRPRALPKLRAREGVQPQAGPHFMPCWKTEFRLVLQMIRSAHWTTTMLTKKAVWQVNSTTFLCSYVCRSERHTGGGGGGSGVL